MTDVWRMTRSLREREAVMALAVALPLGALLLGFYRGKTTTSNQRCSVSSVEATRYRVVVRAVNSSIQIMCA